MKTRFSGRHPARSLWVAACVGADKWLSSYSSVQSPQAQTSPVIAPTSATSCGVFLLALRPYRARRGRVPSDRAMNDYRPCYLGCVLHRLSSQHRNITPDTLQWSIGRAAKLVAECDFTWTRHTWSVTTPGALPGRKSLPGATRAEMLFFAATNNRVLRKC
uniref:Uncharacterized protein n=1 Tax=uncultured prokaryote TaxID=198431 RepID=A0A0H5Q0I2_9ZZZZ|nr:hypothetical protein [uncultured prokaryote]